MHRELDAPNMAAIVAPTAVALHEMNMTMFSTARDARGDEAHSVKEQCRDTEPAETLRAGPTERFGILGHLPRIANAVLGKHASNWIEYVARTARLLPQHRPTASTNTGRPHMRAPLTRAPGPFSSPPPSRPDCKHMGHIPLGPAQTKQSTARFKLLTSNSQVPSNSWTRGLNPMASSHRFTGKRAQQVTRRSLARWTQVT